MVTRRIEGEHREITLASSITAAHDALAALDPVVPIRPSDAAADPDAVGYLDFETLIEIFAQRKSAVPSRSPRQLIADFVEPVIADPAMFQGGRSLSILERLASDLIPNLDENEELRSLAGAIIADEVERHRELATRIYSGIAS
jgi:hypothetical protein